MDTLYPNTAIKVEPVVDFFSKVVSDEHVTKLARKLKFVQRSRKMNVGLFNRAVIESLSSDKEWTLSSIHSYYCYLYSKQYPNEIPISWEPFYDFLARPQFLTYVEELVKICREKALQTKAFSDLCELVTLLQERTDIKDIVAHDGSVVHIHNNTLGRENYYVHDPALKLHDSISIMSFCNSYNNFTAGQADERVNLYDVENEVKNKLFICDAGYGCDGVFRKVMEGGGYFLIKLRLNCGCPIESMQYLTESGAIETPFQPKVNMKKSTRPLRVNEVDVSKLSADMIATTKDGVRLRILKFQVPDQDGKYLTITLATNISADILDLFQIVALYRSRWQVEWMHRSLKGFCSLKGSRSGNQKIQKAIMLFSVITAYLKVILAGVAQEASEDPLNLSAMQVMHKINPYLKDLLELIFLKRSPDKILGYLQICCRQIARNMKKATPSFTNRKQGKYIGWISEHIRRPIIESGMGALWSNITNSTSTRIQLFEVF